ncbi:hypothetical protein HK101_004703, partial [Irineochytrium annulatum]
MDHQQRSRPPRPAGRPVSWREIKKNSGGRKKSQWVRELEDQHGDGLADPLDAVEADIGKGRPAPEGSDQARQRKRTRGGKKLKEKKRKWQDAHGEGTGANAARVESGREIDEEEPREADEEKAE